MKTQKVEVLAEKIIGETEAAKSQLQAKTLKTLEVLKKQEASLKSLVPKDKIAEVKNFESELEEKAGFIQSLSVNPDSLLQMLPTGPYLARLDSLQTLFNFSLSELVPSEQITEALKHIEGLKKQIALAGQMEDWLANREQSWNALLSGNGIGNLQLPKAFGKWQEEALAYKMQLQQWKETINDPKKIETEALKLLNKLPAFRDFMAKNSEIARLFGPPPGSTSLPQGAALPGLQTRQTLAQELIARFGENALQSGGALQQQLLNGMQRVSSQQANPLNELTGKIEENINNLSNQVKEVASISPAQAERASLKSKTFKERLETSWNLQSATRIQDFPAVRDVGLSIGYKLNPRSVVGVGIAYKFALGESWKDIEWTHEGIGLRSYLDWRLTEAGGKLFKGLWLTGGFEMNYWSRIGGNTQLKDLAWQQSGLLGLTKTIKYKKKEGKVQLLWEFLNPPQGVNLPISIRISKNF